MTYTELIQSRLFLIWSLMKYVTAQVNVYYVIADVVHLGQNVVNADAEVVTSQQPVADVGHNSLWTITNWHPAFHSQRDSLTQLLCVGSLLSNTRCTAANLCHQRTPQLNVRRQVLTQHNVTARYYKLNLKHFYFYIVLPLGMYLCTHKCTNDKHGPQSISCLECHSISQTALCSFCPQRKTKISTHNY